MDLLVLAIIFLTVSFWAYSNVWYGKQMLPYTFGYLIFAMIQWLLVLINLWLMYGWLVAIISVVVLMFGGSVVITNFTTNQIYRLLKVAPIFGLALFSISVILLAIITAVNIFV